MRQRRATVPPVPERAQGDSYCAGQKLSCRIRLKAERLLRFLCLGAQVLLANDFAICAAQLRQRHLGLSVSVAVNSGGGWEV